MTLHVPAPVAVKVGYDSVQGPVTLYVTAPVPGPSVRDSVEVAPLAIYVGLADRLIVCVPAVTVTLADADAAE